MLLCCFTAHELNFSASNIALRATLIPLSVFASVPQTPAILFHFLIALLTYTFPVSHTFRVHDHGVHCHHIPVDCLAYSSLITVRIRSATTHAVMNCISYPCLPATPSALGRTCTFLPFTVVSPSYLLLRGYSTAALTAAGLLTRCYFRLLSIIVY